MRVSLCIVNIRIPCATLKRRGSWVKYLWISPQDALMRGGGVALVGWLVQEADPALLDVKVLMAAQLLVEVVAAARLPRLLHQFYQSVLLDFRWCPLLAVLWIRIRLNTLMRIRIQIFIWCVSGFRFLFDAYPDSDFYLMRIQIWILLFTLMRIRIRIQILASK